MLAFKPLNPHKRKKKTLVGGFGVVFCYGVIYLSVFESKSSRILGGGSDEEAEMGNGWKLLGAGHVNSHDSRWVGPTRSGRPNSIGSIKRDSAIEG